MTRSQQRLLWSIVVLLLLTSALTGLVDLFTFRLRWNGHLSGNGNPGLFFVFLLIPLYAVLLFLTGLASRRFFREKMKGGSFSIGSFLFLIVTTAILSLLAYGYYHLIFNGLRGGPDQPDSAIFAWGRWNQYTNTAFINMITYSLGLVCSMILGYASAFITRRGRE
ncbi:hypothetical protein [Paenibacillus sp. DMB20]|uniref:hypothetical protein n=1 Tax=Paenibacillus sp. DMB20 TaxID=1642570 RepID=UPI00062797B8|nr:hypothetical protein [Paenibacillus sp. DMB20]KKO52635.1 hypothetical protein XI25_18425 [Paenibacillus sp. DMB20]